MICRQKWHSEHFASCQVPQNHQNLLSQSRIRGLGGGDSSKIQYRQKSKSAILLIKECSVTKISICFRKYTCSSSRIWFVQFHFVGVSCRLSPILVEQCSKKLQNVSKVLFWAKFPNLRHPNTKVSWLIDLNKPDFVQTILVPNPRLLTTIIRAFFDQ